MGSQAMKDRVLDWSRRLFDSMKGSSDDAASQLDEREEQLALANALSQIGISSSDLKELCEGLAGELGKLVSIDWATIALMDSSTNLLHLSPLSEKIEGAWESEDTVPLEGTPVAWLASNECAMLEPDLKEESRFRTGTALLKRGIRTLLYMPLFSQKKVFGALMLGSQRPNAYGERELKLLKYAVTQLAVAIENSRLFQESRKRTELQADFVTALAHELKTPLTPIRASSELLAEELQGGNGNSQARLAENIAQSATHLDTKLSLMLELAKVQAPSFKLKLERLGIKPLLEKAVGQARPAAEAKNQTLNVVLPASLPRVRANRNQLERVLATLLSNATKLSPSGGNINLTVRKRGGEVVVEVEDSGNGFTAEEVENLFDVYHPTGADRQRVPEMKLGLALSKRLVELHKGRMWVQSSPGKGSTFALSLPLP